MHVIKISGRRGRDLKEWGGICGRVWGAEREGITVVIKLQSQKINKQKHLKKDKIHNVHIPSQPFYP